MTGTGDALPAEVKASGGVTEAKHHQIVSKIQVCDVVCFQVSNQALFQELGSLYYLPQLRQPELPRQNVCIFVPCTGVEKNNPVRWL